MPLRRQRGVLGLNSQAQRQQINSLVQVRERRKWRVAPEVASTTPQILSKGKMTSKVMTYERMNVPGWNFQGILWESDEEKNHG
jgi:hypothetical protein